ncbi:hypothetical protein [Vibrio metschnikovii]|uniref:hypothetical protein n=1 Tax=Vibrio metschnikovii TaxID=28172 RepID=UPI001C2F7C8C|nr:hypothetical protein [Vibrio metschnikovii]
MSDLVPWLIGQKRIGNLLLFALPNEKAIWLALVVQRCCLIRVLCQFAVSLVGQIFVERAFCSLDRGEFNSVFVQIMVSIRFTDFGAWVGLKF